MTLLRGKHRFNRELLLEFRRSAIAFIVTLAAITWLLGAGDKLAVLIGGTILWLLTVAVHLLFVLLGNWRVYLFPISCLWAPVVVTANTVLTYVFETEEYQLYSWLALFLLCSVLLRFWDGKLRPDETLSRVALGAAGAFVLACFVFRVVMGDYWSQWDASNNSIGLPGAAITTVFLGAFYWWRRHLPDAWLVFPVGMVISAPILLLLVKAENTIAEYGGIASVNFWDFIWASFIGLLGTWLLMVLKRYFIDRDRGALIDAVRLRGVFVIFHALIPVFIFLFLLTCFQAFSARSKGDAAEIQANFKALAASAVRAGTAVGTFKDQQVARINATKKVVEDRIDAQTAEAKAILNGAKKDWDEFDDNVRAVASKATEKGKKLAGETFGAIGDALKLPGIPTPFGPIELPDLGIGKAISKAFSGIFADIDFSAMFSSFVADMADDIESQFAGPIARAKEAEDFVKKNLTWAQGLAADQVEAVKKDFAAMTTELEKEKQISLMHLKRSAVNIARLAYYTAILAASFIVCIVMYLLWRMMSGLVVMMERLGRGWKMLRTGEDSVVAQPQPAAVA